MLANSCNDYHLSPTPFILGEVQSDSYYFYPNTPPGVRGSFPCLLNDDLPYHKFQVIFTKYLYHAPDYAKSHSRCVLLGMRVK